MKFKLKINTEWLETNHRVREITMGDGKSTFYPQRKMVFLVWRPIMDPDWSTPKLREYSTLKDANTFLLDRQTERQRRTKRKKVVRTKNHPFNMVFEKLKETND